MIRIVLAMRLIKEKIKVTLYGLASILVFIGNFVTEKCGRELSDSMASCLILFLACGKHDQSIVERLGKLALPKSSSKSGSRSLGANFRLSEQPTDKNSSPCSGTLIFQTLLDTFPISAFFLLVNNAIGLDLGADDMQAQEDISLLQRVCKCY